MIIVIGGGLLTGHSAWSSRNFTFATERSGWNDSTIFSNGCLSSTGSARRAKLFIATTVRSLSSCTTPTSERSSRYKGLRLGLRLSTVLPRVNRARLDHRLRGRARRGDQAAPRAFWLSK